MCCSAALWVLLDLETAVMRIAPGRTELGYDGVLDLWNRFVRPVPIIASAVVAIVGSLEGIWSEHTTTRLSGSWVAIPSVGTVALLDASSLVHPSP